MENIVLQLTETDLRFLIFSRIHAQFKYKYTYIHFDWDSAYYLLLKCSLLLDFVRYNCLFLPCDLLHAQIRRGSVFK